MRWWEPPYRLGAVAFVVSVAYWDRIFPAPTLPRWWGIAIGLPLLCALVPLKRNEGAAWLVGLGSLWALAAVLMSGFPEGGWLPLYYLVLLVVAGFAGAAVGDFSPVMCGFAIGAAVNSILTPCQAFGISPVPTTGWPSGLFINSEVLAEFIAPVLVWALVSKRWAVAAVLSAPIILCHSRIAVLGVCAGLIWALPVRKGWLKTLIAAGFGVLAVAAVLLIWPEKIHSTMHRLVLWGAAIHSITPLGHGLGWWASAHPYGFEEFVHSDLLQLLVENGIGGLFFIAIPVLIFWRGIDDKALGACFAALCFEAVVSFPIQVPATAFLFAVLAGHLACGGDVVRRPERESASAGGIGLRWGMAIRARILGYRGKDRDRLPLGSAYPADARGYPPPRPALHGAA